MRYEISEKVVLMMIDGPQSPDKPRLCGRDRAEHTRNLAKVSRFYDYLIEYLEDINSFLRKLKHMNHY